MPKKRNTRKHKISIEQRRNNGQEVLKTIESPGVVTEANKQAESTTGMTFSLPTNIKAPHTVIKNHVQTTVISTENYDYLSKDLMRTAILSMAIVITEIVIKIFFKT